MLFRVRRPASRAQEARRAERADRQTLAAGRPSCVRHAGGRQSFAPVQLAIVPGVRQGVCNTRALCLDAFYVCFGACRWVPQQGHVRLSGCLASLMNAGGALKAVCALSQITPHWERLSKHIEDDKVTKDLLGWVREMYAWDIGAALEGIKFDLTLPANVRLAAPADRQTDRQTDRLPDCHARQPAGQPPCACNMSAHDFGRAFGQADGKADRQTG
jgi:hypothetical protein